MDTFIPSYLNHLTQLELFTPYAKRVIASSVLSQSRKELVAAEDHQHSNPSDRGEW